MKESTNEVLHTHINEYMHVLYIHIQYVHHYYYFHPSLLMINLHTYSREEQREVAAMMMAGPQER